MRTGAVLRRFTLIGPYAGLRDPFSDDVVNPGKEHRRGTASAVGDSRTVVQIRVPWLHAFGMTGSCLSASLPYSQQLPLFAHPNNPTNWWTNL